MNERQCTCCFTGHRPERLPWGSSEGDPRCAALKRKLYAAVNAAYESGMRYFICGMARGSDFYFAEAVLTLRREKGDVTLEAAIPCAAQSGGWPEADQARWRSLLAQCDLETLVQEQYTKGCMLRRNRYMVDHSSILLAVYNGAYRSGTGMTVRYAQQLKKELYILDPVTREITHKPANVDAVSSKKPVEIFPSMC